MNRELANIIFLTFLVVPASTLIFQVIRGEIKPISHQKSYRKIIAIAFFPCTLVDYIRIILVTWAVVIATLSRQPSHYQICCLLTVNVILDAVDGFLARRYNHQSGFGMALDLILDVSTATVIWYLSSINLSFIFVLVEWVGAITILYSSFLKSSTHWKTSLNKSNSRLLKLYFSNNQRNWLSTYAVIAHFVFPMAYVIHQPQPWLLTITLPGLLLFEFVTIYLVIVLIKQKNFEPKPN